MTHRIGSAGKNATGLAEDVPVGNGHPEAAGDWKAVHDIDPGPGKLCKDGAAEM